MHTKRVPRNWPGSSGYQVTEGDQYQLPAALAGLPGPPQAFYVGLSEIDTRRQFRIGGQIFETSLKKRVVGYARERVLV